MAVVTTQQKVAALYTAIFNRAPDQAGLNFWTAQINAGTSFASIAAGFAQHEVFTTGIGALDNAGYVSALYTNILGSAGDTAGIAYWTARLAAGESKAAIVAEFVNGSLTIDIPALLASGGISAADAAAATIRQQTLTNKADVGIYFANTLGAASNLNPATVSTSKAGLEADPIYKASQAAIAGVDSTAASVQTAKDAIAVAAGSANPAEALLGHTFTLTTGADTFVGGASADIFNALTVKADGADASTLTGFDSIDGGAGNDTLNIYSDGTLNASLPTSATVKNVETINIYNQDAVKAFGAAAGIDASKFVGATAINQIGTVAADVINLAAGTTAGFNGADLADLSVDGAATATSAAIALTGVKGDVGNVVNLAVSGTALNTVNVSGSIAQHTTTAGAAAASLALEVTAGDDTATLTVNSAVATTLSVIDGANVDVSTVDASASTGSIAFNVDNVAAPTDVGAAAAVTTLKTGAGNDVVGLGTVLSSTVKAASVSTGAGDDTLFVNVDSTTNTITDGTVAVDAGEGKDTINLTIADGVTYNVAAGAGDDTVVITGTVKTTDKIDGGEGTDTVSLAAKATYVADDYIVFNKVLTNFETLKLTGAQATALDASQLVAGYTTIDINAGSAVTKVGTQALIANGDVTATANGFVLDADANTAGNQSTYAGTLNITEKLSGAVVASAQTVNLTVEGGKGNPIAPNAVVLSGEAKSATVTLSAGTDTKNTVATTDDTLVASTVEITTGTGANGLKDLASLTLSGNGEATVLNGAGSKLVTVDASGLNSVDVKGVATAGLDYTSNNVLAETIKLGAGLDTVTLTNSKYGAVDTVQGLNLVLNAGGTALDLAKSDKLVVTSTPATTFAKFTTTQTDLDLALKDAAAYKVGGSDVDSLVFQFGGNTYVFQDKGTDANLLDAADTVVQLTGQVNLDALILSVNAA